MDPPALAFRDLNTGSSAHLMIRFVDDGLALGLAVEANGDLDVTLSTEDARRLGEAILAAAAARP